MTKEELKAHCKKEIGICEFLAHGKVEELNHDMIYQEHKLILELLEQVAILDKIRAEIEKLPITDTAIRLVCEIIGRHQAESEDSE